MVRLRLQRTGRKKRPSYRIVAADSRAPRDGSFLEIIGHYDAMQDPPTVVIDSEKALKWLKTGAQASDTVKSLFRREGLLDKFESEKI